MLISELFYSIQGEGVTTGMPSIFIRFPGCNLICGGHNATLVKSGLATWHCDSEKIWKESKEWTEQELLDWFSPYIKSIHGGDVRIIFTGGEPLLKHNYENILKIKKLIGRMDCEVETNGTVEADLSIFDQINCSPKLGNSGMPFSMRKNPAALDQIVRHHNYWLKFVISSEDDLVEMMDYLEYTDADMSRVVLMPACDNREALPQATKAVWEMAMKHRLRMTSRLHILAFDKTVGV